MTFETSIFITGAVVTFGLQFSAFLVAYMLTTEVFYDIIGGTNFLLLAFLGHYNRKEPASARHVGMTILFVASRGWLLTFLAWRAHKRKGDSRFDEAKHKFGMFLVFWMAQAFWVFLISWPLLTVQALDFGLELLEQELTFFDKVTMAGFGVGVLTEVVGDIQKAQWVEQGRPGGFCRVGLWSYSRHPNYFGEILMWWCAWLLSYGSLAASSTSTSSEDSSINLPFLFWLGGIWSPVFTMHVLLNLPATGVWNAEGKNLKRYYESENVEAYKEYRESTSPLVPMVGYKSIPLWIKRVFLFEWERFEYNPKKKE